MHFHLSHLIIIVSLLEPLQAKVVSKPSVRPEVDPDKEVLSGQS